MSEEHTESATTPAAAPAAAATPATPHTETPGQQPHSAAPTADSTPRQDTASADNPSSTPGHASSTPSAPSPARSSPSPVPTKKPGSPTASPIAAPVVVPVVEAASPEPVDPHLWGRMADDGAVFVRTSAGEREIGSWQAGDAEAGLAHFARRFDDFMTEVALLEARIASGSGDAKSTHKQAVALRASLTDLAAIGDFASAEARVAALITDAEAAIARAAEDRAAARAAAIATKEKLCAEAEKLATSTQWKATGDRLRAIVDQWRTIHGIDRKTDDALWKRFARARDAFTRARGSHFADLDKQRLVAKAAKEKLIKQAQALSTSRDWSETTAAYRDLMREWKAAGRAPREAEDALWEEFRAAQEEFFSRRNEVYAERDAEFEENAKVKDQLLVEAEKIDPQADLTAAKAQLRSIQERWDAAGKVPRNRMRELDGRLQAVEEKVRAASEAEWQRTDPEAEARVAQFAARVEQFRQQAEKARAAGNARKAKEAEEQAVTWEGWLAAARGAIE